MGRLLPRVHPAAGGRPVPLPRVEPGTGRPAAVRFWYRTSPRPLLPISKNSPVGTLDPPLQLNGMTTAIFDTKGRLLRFESAQVAHHGVAVLLRHGDVADEDVGRVGAERVDRRRR